MPSDCSQSPHSGIPLLAGGILYFLLLGRRVLPKPAELPSVTPQEELIDAWGLPRSVSYVKIPHNSPLVGKTPESALLWNEYRLHLLALEEENDILYAPWRHTAFSPGQQLALLGREEDATRFTSDFRLRKAGDQTRLESLMRSGEDAGFAELIVRPRSTAPGLTLRQLALRKNHAVEPILLMSGTREERGDFSDVPLAVGDTMVVHGLWANIKSLENDRDFVLLTPVEGVSHGHARPIRALLCFVAGIALALSGVQLSLGLLTGALAMILFGVMTIDEAYRAIDWRTVFLLAGLIPLGIAMETIGRCSIHRKWSRRRRGGEPSVAASPCGWRAVHGVLSLHVKRRCHGTPRATRHLDSKPDRHGSETPGTAGSPVRIEFVHPSHSPGKRPADERRGIPQS